MRLPLRLGTSLATLCVALCLLSRPAQAASEINLFGALAPPATVKSGSYGAALYAKHSAGAAAFADFEVLIARTGPPDCTPLTVAVDNTVVGSITVRDGHGSLVLSTGHRHTVPAVQFGSAISVSDPAGHIILGGSITDRQTSLEAMLAGSAALKTSPTHGVARYLDTAGRLTETLLAVEAAGVGLADGTALTVFSDAIQVGKITLKHGASALLLNSQKKDVIPPLQMGSRLWIKDSAGNTVLSGSF